MRLSTKFFKAILIVSSILFTLTLASPIIIRLIISSMTGTPIDNNASSIAIIGSADGPTVVYSVTTIAGMPIFRYGLLGICVIAIAFSVIKIRSIMKESSNYQ